MTTQMSVLQGPVTFTLPSSSTRYYYNGEGSVANVNGTIYIALPYSDPAQGLSTEQALTYIGYSFNPSGALTFNQANTIDSWFNSDSPQNIPSQYLEWDLKAFNGPNSQSVFGEYFETLNGDGTATYHVGVIDTSGATPTPTRVNVVNVTTTPIAKTVAGDGTAHLATLSNDEELFEVEGAPAPGQVQGTFEIFDSKGNGVPLALGPQTAFNFTDGKPHVFAIGRWNSNNFGQLVEVWNQSSRLADVQLSLIGNGISTGWTAATELQSITKLSWQFASGAGTGMILAADGTNAAGVQGVSLFNLNDTTAEAGGAGGTITASAFIPYSGTVVADADIAGSGISNEFVVSWVDSTGMNIDVINSNLQVLETYNIAAANGTGDVTPLGNGQLLVTYSVQSSPTSAVDDALILDAIPNAAPPAGTTADLIMTQPSTGNYEIYDIGNNAVLAAYPLTNASSPWQAVDVGAFNGSDTSDLLLRNSSTGAFELYDVSGNNASPAVQLGAVGIDWSVLGFGDFSGNPGETDMLLRQSGTAKLEVYDISNNQITNAASMGAVGPEWNFLGVGDFSSNPNETDLLMRDSNNGALEVYNVSHNAIVGATGMGAIGVEWNFVGVGDFSGNAGETDMLMRNQNTGALEVYNVHNDQIVSASAMGAVGAEWSVVGIGDFSGNPGETDMITRNANTGAFEIYDISHDAIVSASSIGSVGTDWQTAGIAPYQSGSGAIASSTNAPLETLAPGADSLVFGQTSATAPAADVSGPTWGAGDATPMLTGGLFQHA